MRWMVLAALVVCGSCTKRAPAVSALERTHTKGGLEVAWSDRNGANRAVFRIVDTEETEEGGGRSRHASVEVTANGAPLGSWSADTGGCEFDLVGGFSAAALALTDLDHDGIGELVFANVLNCVSGLQPLSLQVVILEGADRYVLAGTTHIDYGGGETEGGAATPDAALAKSAFLPHARAVWAKIVEQTNWE